MSRSVTVTQQNNIESHHRRACDRTIDQLYNNKSSGKPISSHVNNNNQQQQSSPSSSEQSGDGVSKKLDMQLSDTKTMLPHDIYREQT